MGDFVFDRREFRLVRLCRGFADVLPQGVLDIFRVIFEQFAKAAELVHAEGPGMGCPGGSEGSQLLDPCGHRLVGACGHAFHRTTIWRTNTGATLKRVS